VSPYFEKDGLTIYQGDCRDILPSLPKVDLVLTDPPYSERTHAGARGHWAPRKEDHIVEAAFGSVTREWLRETLALCVPKRWVVSFMDYTMVPWLEENPPEGMRGVRMGIWVKPNGAPQFTGDRPGMGWEAIWIGHNLGEKLRWNGVGRHGVWNCPIEQGAHPTMKPLKLVRELASLFSEDGETILDPFMGSGTTLVAARDLGRKAIGIEIEERYCEIAALRLSQNLLPFGTTDGR
jgi:site-specific DNA-methyltransferase (adenine-specific)